MLVLLVSWLFLSCNFGSSKYDFSVVTYQELNKLVEDLIDADSRATDSMRPIYSVLSSSGSILNVPEVHDAVNLSKDDIIFMAYQDSMFKHVQLNAQLFSRYKIVNKPAISSYICSVPLLTADRNNLIVLIFYNTGFFSGDSDIVIFEKKDREWVEKERIFYDIS